MPVPRSDGSMIDGWVTGGALNLQDRVRLPVELLTLGAIRWPDSPSSTSRFESGVVSPAGRLAED